MPNLEFPSYGNTPHVSNTNTCFFTGQTANTKRGYGKRPPIASVRRFATLLQRKCVRKKGILFHTDTDSSDLFDKTYENGRGYPKGEKYVFVRNRRTSETRCTRDSCECHEIEKDGHGSQDTPTGDDEMVAKPVDRQRTIGYWCSTTARQTAIAQIVLFAGLHTAASGTTPAYLWTFPSAAPTPVFYNLSPRWHCRHPPIGLQVKPFA